MKIPILFIVGPTGVGKTDLAIRLARIFKTEIISADSMQVYRGMDIGTAKVSMADREAIPHHLIDIVNPSQEFSVYEFRVRALSAMRHISQMGRIPLIVGGTGLYIRSLTQGLSPVLKSSDTARIQLQQECQRLGLDAMYDKLLKLDPERALKLARSDERRILRALEIIEAAGKTPSDIYENKESISELGYQPYLAGISMDRALLYQRLNQRVDEMIAAGLEQEVKLLSEHKISQSASQAVGYKELLGAFRGEMTLENAIDLIKQRSRNLAKRQMTWFKRETGIRWYSHQGDVEAIAAEIVRDFSKEAGTVV